MIFWTGGAGADIFRWLSGDDEVRTDFDDDGDGVPTDTIVDFNDAEGDTIEIGNLLLGEGSGDDLIASGHIEFEVKGGSTHVFIDANGSNNAGGNAFNATQEIILDGTVFAPTAGQTFSLNGDTLVITPIELPPE